MTTAPSVSVVIPTYNQAELLKLALRSVVDQTVSNWEAIVINNHSADNTVDVVTGFDDARIKLVDFRNHGVIAASRNKGIELATADWIAFLDSDDLWRSEKLERCLQAAGDAIDFVSHREATINDDKVVAVSPHHSTTQATYRSLLFNGTCFSPTAVLVRRTMLNDIGGFSEDPDLITCEDYDLWLRLAQAGARVMFIEPVLSDYRLHEGNTSASVLRHMNAGLTAVDRHYRKHRPRRPFDWLRLRRRRAGIIYGAGRSFQRARDHDAASACFVKSIAAYPLAARVYAACIFGLFSVRGPQMGANGEQRT